MITVQVKYKHGTKSTFNFNSLAIALEKTRESLDIGDRYVILENETLLASGLIEDYKEDYKTKQSKHKRSY